MLYDRILLSLNVRLSLKTGTVDSKCYDDQ